MKVWHIIQNRPINIIELLPDDEMYFGMEMAEWNEPIAIARDSICPHCISGRSHIHQLGEHIHAFGAPAGKNPPKNHATHTP